MRIFSLLPHPFKASWRHWQRWRIHALNQQAQHWRKPKHIGIILDGNRRFARNQGLASTLEGHKRGADKLIEVLDWCQTLGIKTLSVWVFSLDNFQRPAAEVDSLMALFAQKFSSLATDERVHKNQIRVRALGQRQHLPKLVQQAISTAEQSTQHYKRFLLQLYIAYSGQEELSDAAKAYLTQQNQQGQSLTEAIQGLSPQTLQAYLYAPKVDDVDLIIRTSGELRLSGFMLWQSAYAELYFCSTHWPGFQKKDLLQALQSYHQRSRRFGR